MMNRIVYSYAHATRSDFSVFPITSGDSSAQQSAARHVMAAMNSIGRTAGYIMTDCDSSEFQSVEADLRAKFEGGEL